MLNVIKISLPSIFLPVVFLKALFSVLYFSSCTPPHSALLSLTYKVLTTSQPDYLHNLISVQSSGRTRSSSVVILARPSVSSSLQITNRSFRYASPYLWTGINSLLHSVNLILCLLSSLFTSSYAYHRITVITFVLTICHCLGLSLQT